MPRSRHPRDQRLTLSQGREVISRAVRERAEDDDRLFLLDGRELLGSDEAHLLPDNLHPNAEGNDLIATRFAALAREPSSPLGRAIGVARETTEARYGTPPTT